MSIVKNEINDCVWIVEYQEGRFCPFLVVLFALGRGGALFGVSASVSNPAAILNHP